MLANRVTMCSFKPKSISIPPYILFDMYDFNAVDVEKGAFVDFEDNYPYIIAWYPPSYFPPIPQFVGFDFHVPYTYSKLTINMMVIDEVNGIDYLYIDINGKEYKAFSAEELNQYYEDYEPLVKTIDIEPVQGDIKIKWVFKQYEYNDYSFGCELHSWQLEQ